MADTLWGDVIRVVDGDTFDVRVTNYSRQNQFPYNTVERVRLASTHAPELTSVSGCTAKQRLANRVWNRRVRLTVYTRDVYGLLVCDVSLANTT